MTKTYMDYEFFKQTQSEKWKPQQKHYAIRFAIRLVLATVLMWIFLCGAILIAPVHADTLPKYDTQHEKMLSYVGLQIDDNSITCLLFVDSTGKIERFAYYDELSNYKQYVGSMAVYDYDSDMLAIYQYIGNFEWRLIFSDWD